MLTLDISLVFGLNLHLRRNCRITDERSSSRKLCQRGVNHSRTLQKIHERVVALDRLAEHTLSYLGRQRLGTDPSGLEPLLLAADRITLAIERVPAGIVHYAEPATGLGESQVRIVLAQHEDRKSTRLNPVTVPSR